MRRINWIIESSVYILVSVTFTRENFYAEKKNEKVRFGGGDI